MSRALIALCATLLAATVSSAQAPPVRAIQIQPIQAPVNQPAPATQATQLPPAAPASDAAQAVPAEPIGPVQTPEALAAANKQLRENNRLLRNENSALKDRILQMTTPGGSQVRAYCPNESTSRNTAGAEANCAASGYTCEAVSGLCRNTCSTSDQCAGGYTCNPCNRQCEYTAGGVVPGDCGG